MAQVLELAHLAQRHGVAQVQVRAGGVDAELDVEGLALLKLLAKVGLGDDLRGARGDDTHLLVNRQHWVSSFCYSTSPKTAVLEVHKLSYDNKLTRRSTYDRKILVLPHASTATGRRVPSRSTK